MDDSRIKRLQKQLSSPCFIEQEADLLYLTGLLLSKGRLFVGKDEAILFVDGRYYDYAKEKAPCKVEMWDEVKKLKLTRLAFDSASISYDGYLALKKELPHVEWEPIANPVKWVRALKEPKEIAALKKAADLTWKGYKHVVSCFKEGVSEEDLAWEFEKFCREKGSSGMSFSPIIAFGENGAYPHHRAGKARLKKDQMVLIDVGAIVDQYHGDMTRMAHFGKPSSEILRFEEIVDRAQRMAVKAVKPGVLLGTLDQIVRDEFDKANVKQLYMHSLGHGVGLDTHEFPRLRFDNEDRNIPLEKGMVFTIEPGLYKAGVGGIRIEDMILVTENGYENLFHDR